MRGLLSGVIVCLLLTGCQHARRSRSELPPRYPELFRAGDSAPYGVGFSRLYSRSMEEAIGRASVMALRSLAWAIHVRVAGERLFERVGDGDLEFRGDNIELLETPELVLEDCVAETLVTDSHVWIAARTTGRAGSQQLGEVAPFGAERPDWVMETPFDSQWIFASGTARFSHRDEPGAWEVAAYRAVVELAFSTGLVHRNVEKATEGYTAGASADAVDARLNGVRVMGRWRDHAHAYVLVATPVVGQE